MLWRFINYRYNNNNNNNNISALEDKHKGTVDAIT